MQPEDSSRPSGLQLGSLNRSAPHTGLPLQTESVVKICTHPPTLVWEQ